MNSRATVLRAHSPITQWLRALFDPGLKSPRRINLILIYRIERRPA